MTQIAVLTLGSRGDIQPFIALSIGLKRAGFAVKLVTYSKFEVLVRSYGVDCFPLQNSYEERLVHIIRTPSNPFFRSNQIEKAITPILKKVLIECLKGCEGADLIVSAATAFWGFDIAEYLGVPNVAVGLIPLNPTKEFPHCIFPQVNINGFLNELTANLVGHTFWLGFKVGINNWRKETLGLEKWDGVPFESKQWQEQLQLLAYSPALLPQPSDWGSNVHTTGFWFLDEHEGFNPSEELLRFLSEGSEPVYIGFGSMTLEKEERFKWIEAFLEALRRTGHRGILSGHLAEGLSPENHILCVDSVPHSWLFPKMALVVHHGGVGTTGAALRAGRPSVVVPFFIDQPFWAGRLRKLGLSPKSIRKDDLTSELVVAAIGSVECSNRMSANAKRMSEKVKSERGVERAVSLIAACLNRYNN